MNRFEGIRPSVGKIIACSVLAIVLGVLQPLVLIFQMMMPAPAISLAMVAAVAMYGSGGIIPVVLLASSASLSIVMVCGPAIGAFSMLLWLAPAIFIMWGMNRRSPFFGQLKGGIAAAVAAMLVSMVGMVAVYGSDLIAQFIDHARQNFESQKVLFWQLTAPMFSVEMTLEQFVEMYYTAFNTLQLYYEYYLPANLISGAIASACIAVLWGNWKLAKRGMATAESYCSLSQWRLPANTVWGLLLMLSVGFIMAQMNLGAAKSAWFIVQSLCQLAFAIQFFGALSRRMRNSSGYRMRTVMIALLCIMGYSSGSIGLMAILGGVSALFGSQGAAKAVIDKIKNNTNGEDR